MKDFLIVLLGSRSIDVNHLSPGSCVEGSTCWEHSVKYDQTGELYQGNILLLSLCDKPKTRLWEFGPGLNLVSRNHNGVVIS